MKSWQELRNWLEWEIFPRWEEKYFAHAGIVLSASYEKYFIEVTFSLEIVFVYLRRDRWGEVVWITNWGEACRGGGGKKELHNNQSKTGARGGNETIHPIKLPKGRTDKPSRTYLCFFLLSKNYTLKLPRAETTQKTISFVTAKYLDHCLNQTELYKKWNGNAVDDRVTVSNSLWNSNIVLSLAVWMGLDCANDLQIWYLNFSCLGFCRCFCLIFLTIRFFSIPTSWWWEAGPG